MKWRRYLVAAVLFTQMSGPSIAQTGSRDSGPPNSPAVVQIRGNEITVDYDGAVLFKGVIDGGGAQIHQKTQVYNEAGALQQVILLTTMDWRKRFTIRGTVTGSEESFPCESDRPTDRAGQGPLIVRNASGIGINLRNRAVYDRRRDWVFSVDANPKVVISPVELGQSHNAFTVETEGYEIVLRFRPHYFQKHRGLEFFKPWTYSVWPASVAGWISWFAFYDKVSEKDMIETADVFSETLARFGYEYFQMDDGYQRGNGEPELWLKPNDKFPHGLKYLADYIRGKGLKPGLWMGVGFSHEEFVQKHRDWFVRDTSGRPVKGNWIGFPLDASNRDALENVVKPIFTGFREQGWDYFKVDGLRHLRYEGYNAYRDYFDRKNVDLLEAYRAYAKTVRTAIGREHFMLGCWGIRPELVGIIDGCRIGDDGFSYAGLAQYNSFNNIVWRNDPDHIELNDDAYRSTMVTSLTGSLLMLTDKPAVYRTPVIEPARRAAPVLFTRPGQLYDVDPSRSSLLERVSSEVSGSGPRPFDAGYVPLCHLYSLEINRPFGSWILLGRTGGEFPEIRLADLGLPADKEFLIFEYWSKSLKGTFVEKFEPGSIDPRFGCQLFCVREVLHRPQLVATNRHISCGGVELEELFYNESVLSGRSHIVGNDPYTVYVFEPLGYQFKGAECVGATVAGTAKRGMIREVTFQAASSAAVQWRINY